MNLHWRLRRPAFLRTLVAVIGLSLSIGLLGLLVYDQTRFSATLHRVKANQAAITADQARLAEDQRRLDAANELIDKLEHRILQNSARINRQRRLIHALDAQIRDFGEVPVTLPPRSQPKSSSPAPPRHRHHHGGSSPSPSPSPSSLIPPIPTPSTCLPSCLKPIPTDLESPHAR